MLEHADLSIKMSDEEYNEAIDGLRLRLGELQRRARDANIPIIVIIEGWDVSGKADVINHLIRALDPRGFRVYSITKPNDEERARPFLWRFWMRTPAKGRISIFQNSWYRRSLTEILSIKKENDGYLTSKNDRRHIDEIVGFERQLSLDGTLIVKIFLHISKKKQKERFEDLERNPVKSWSVTNVDWKLHKQYEEYYPVIDKMLQVTDTIYAPWNVIGAEDRDHARFTAYNVLIEAIEKKLMAIEPKTRSNYSTPIAPYTPILESVDMDHKIEKDEYQRKLKSCQKRLSELQWILFKEKIPSVIVFEGWDASGKGGNIKKLAESLDPRGYTVVPVSAPDFLEQSHHYLWRFWKEIPPEGMITVFDRSWYGRVLVERVEKLISHLEWERAYNEINEMESSLLAKDMLLLKFWLQIDKETQLKRFDEREEDPYKTWKITEEDWRNREKWEAYEASVKEMIVRTGTKEAPWTVVPSNDKYYSRITVLQAIIDSMEKAII